MRPFRFWVPVVCALVALGSGLFPYLGVTRTGRMPVWLRDRPWPMEVVAAVATMLAVWLAVRAFRARRLRVLATLCAAAAVFGTVVFFLFVHSFAYMLPPAPKELAVGTVAPDFTLPDETGRPVTLASLRGHPTLLVFYRGFW